MHPYMRENQELCDKAWHAVGPAFLSSIPAAMGLSTFFVWWLSRDTGQKDFVPAWVAVCSLIIGVGIAVPFWWKWSRSIRDLNRFTKRMRAISG